MVTVHTTLGRKRSVYFFELALKQSLTRRRVRISELSAMGGLVRSIQPACLQSPFFFCFVCVRVCLQCSGAGALPWMCDDVFGSTERLV